MSTDVLPPKEYIPRSHVSCWHPKEIIDQAIAIPGVLESDDGRLFHIHRWEPDVQIGKAIEITIRVLVSLEEK